MEVCVPVQLSRASPSINVNRWLRGGNIGTPADGRALERLQSSTGETINVAKLVKAVFLHATQASFPLSGSSCSPTVSSSTYDDARAGSVRQQLGLVVCKVNVARVNILRLRANGIAPTLEVRRIMFTKMGKRSDTLFGGAWIEHNLNEAKEAVVLDDEFETGDEAIDCYDRGTEPFLIER